MRYLNRSLQRHSIAPFIACVFYNIIILVRAESQSTIQVTSQCENQVGDYPCFVSYIEALYYTENNIPADSLVTINLLDKMITEEKNHLIEKLGIEKFPLEIFRTRNDLSIQIRSDVDTILILNKLLVFYPGKELEIQGVIFDSSADDKIQSKEAVSYTYFNLPYIEAKQYIISLQNCTFTNNINEASFLWLENYGEFNVELKNVVFISNSNFYIISLFYSSESSPQPPDPGRRMIKFENCIFFLTNLTNEYAYSFHISVIALEFNDCDVEFFINFILDEGHSKITFKGLNLNYELLQTQVNTKNEHFGIISMENTNITIEKSIVSKRNKSPVINMVHIFLYENCTLELKDSKIYQLFSKFFIQSSATNSFSIISNDFQFFNSFDDSSALFLLERGSDLEFKNNVIDFEIITGGSVFHLLNSNILNFSKNEIGINIIDSSMEFSFILCEESNLITFENGLITVDNTKKLFFNLTGQGGIVLRKENFLNITKSIIQLTFRVNGDADNIITISDTIFDQSYGIINVGVNNSIDIMNVEIRTCKALGGCILLLSSRNTAIISNLQVKNIEVQVSGGILKGYVNNSITIYEITIESVISQLDGGGFWLKEDNKLVVKNAIFSNVGTNNGNGGLYWASKNNYISISNFSVYKAFGLQGGVIMMNEENILLVEKGYFDNSMAQINTQTGGVGYFRQKNYIFFSNCLVKSFTVLFFGSFLLVSNEANQLIIRSSGLTDCKSYESSSIDFFSNGKVQIIDSFVYKQEGNSGGVLRLISNAYLLMENCYIWSISAYDGGVLFFGSDNKLVLKKSNFWLIESIREGGAIFLENSNSLLMIGSLFLYCLANQNGGAMVLSAENNLYVENSGFFNCSSETKGSVMKAYLLNIVVFNHFKFRESLNGESVLEFSSNNTLLLLGGEFSRYTLESLISINKNNNGLIIGCYFIDISGTKGAISSLTQMNCMVFELLKVVSINVKEALIFTGNSNVLFVKGGDFTEIVTGGAGVFFLDFSNLVEISEIRVINFTSTSGGIVLAYNRNFVFISSSEFSKGQSNNGGCFFLSQNNFMEVKNSSAYLVMANDGNFLQAMSMNNISIINTEIIELVNTDYTSSIYLQTGSYISMWNMTYKDNSENLPIPIYIVYNNSIEIKNSFLILNIIHNLIKLGYSNKFYLENTIIKIENTRDYLDRFSINLIQGDHDNNFEIFKQKFEYLKGFGCLINTIQTGFLLMKETNFTKNSVLSYLIFFEGNAYIWNSIYVCENCVYGGNEVGELHFHVMYTDYTMLKNLKILSTAILKALIHLENANKIEFKNINIKSSLKYSPDPLNINKNLSFLLISAQKSVLLFRLSIHISKLEYLDHSSLIAIRGEEVNIESCLFILNILPNGTDGLINFDVTEKSFENRIFTIKSSIFIKNIIKKGSGGVAQILNLNLIKIKNNRFMFNQASDSSGKKGFGGVFYFANTNGLINKELDPEDIILNFFSNNAFIGNRASKGGILYLTGWSSSNNSIILTVVEKFYIMNNISSNIATDYGNDIASGPCTLWLSVNLSGLFSSIKQEFIRDPFYFISREQAPGIKLNIKDSKTYSECLLMISGLDAFNQVTIKSEDYIPNSSATDYVTSLSQVGLNDTIDFIFDTNQGVYCLKAANSSLGFELMGTDKAQYEVKFDFPGKQNDYSKSLQLKFVSCDIGETLNPSTLICEECPAGFYSLNNDFNSTGTCEKCVDSFRFYCYGGSKIAPKPKYWRLQKNSKLFLPCPLPEACLGDIYYGSDDALTFFEESDSAVGYCWKGYTGLLCAECEEGYGSLLSFSCESCDHGLFYQNLIPQLLLRIILIYYSIYKAIKLNYQLERDPTVAAHRNGSYLLKLLTNHFQILGILRSVAPSFPEILDFMTTITITSVAPDISNSLSFSCMLKNNGVDFSATYFRLILLEIFNVFTILVSLVYISISSYRREKKRLKELTGEKPKISFFKFAKQTIFKNFYSLILIYILLTFVDQLKPFLEMINCLSIDDDENNKHEIYLIKDLKISCLSHDHQNIIYKIVIPVLVIIGVFIPLNLLGILIMKKLNQKLYDPEEMGKYGYFFYAYRKSRFFFEIFVILRRAVLGAVDVYFMNSYALNFSPNSKTDAIAILFCVVSFFSFLFSIGKPFDKAYNHLHKVRVAGDYCILVTIFSFLVWHVQASSGEAKFAFVLALFALTVFYNLIFLFYWVYNYRNIAKSQIRKAQKIIKSVINPIASQILLYKDHKLKQKKHNAKRDKFKRQNQAEDYILEEDENFEMLESQFVDPNFIELNVISLQRRMSEAPPLILDLPQLNRNRLSFNSNTINMDTFLILLTLAEEEKKRLRAKLKEAQNGQDSPINWRSFSYKKEQDNIKETPNPKTEILSPDENTNLKENEEFPNESIIINTVYEKDSVDWSFRNNLEYGVDLNHYYLEIVFEFYDKDSQVSFKIDTSKSLVAKFSASKNGEYTLANVYVRPFELLNLGSSYIHLHVIYTHEDTKARFLQKIISINFSQGLTNKWKNLIMINEDLPLD